MTLHPLAARFASVADAYERGRPGYAPAVVGALAAELALDPGARVLDLAAGTGKLTRSLLAAGYDVVAVEPQAELREKLAATIGAERVHEGVAERIPLPGDAVEAVTIADAFHWFDAAAALAEIRRVLMPGGRLAILTAAPDWREASWAEELGALIEAMRPEHPFFDGPPWEEAAAADGAWTASRQVRVITPEPTDPARIVDYVTSMSFVAALAGEERERFLAQVAELVEAGQMPAELPVHFVIGWTTLR